MSGSPPVDDHGDDLYGGLGIALVILLFLYLAARAFVGGGFADPTFSGIAHAPLAERLADDDRDTRSGAGGG